MKSKFKQGIEEFENESYDCALKHFESIGQDDDDYEISLLYKISCLIHLKRYRQALSLSNRLIEKYPREFPLWFDKARCHILLKEYDEMESALNHLERIVDKTDKVDLLYMAKLYNYLHDNSKALEYVNMALEIDENYVDALDEKFLTAVQLRDKKSQEEAIVKLYDISDKRLIDSMPLFFMILLSKDYEGALDLLNEANVQKEDENYVELYKGAIYKHLTDDLNAQLMLDDNIELDVEDAIRIMLEFKENGTDHGQIHGVNYFVL